MIDYSGTEGSYKISLVIEPDKEHNLIRAHIEMDGEVAKLSTISLSACSQDGRLYEEWKTALDNALDRLIKRMGGINVQSYEDWEVN